MDGRGNSKMKYKPITKDKPHIELRLQEDPTFVNYLALAAAILDPVKNRDMRFYLNGLFDEEEARYRMNKIDEDKEMGCDTYIVNLEKQEQIKRLANKELNKGVPVLVINNHAGTEEKFKTLKEACEEYDLRYVNVKNYFSRKRTREIMYHGLILKKLK